MSRAILSNFLELAFPISCIKCEKEGTLICARCFSTIPTILANHCAFCEKKTNFGETCEDCSAHHFLDGAISCIPYSNELVQILIHLWKYDSIKQVTQYLAQFALQSISHAQRRARMHAQKFIEQGIQKTDINVMTSTPAILTNTDIALQAIPLHPKREKERGFNQAYVLALHLAHNLEKWHIVNFLKRAKKTSAQATLSGLDRSTNISDAFVLNEAHNIQGKHIVIVDDVITTGSTIDAAAKLFKDAGAESVWALTICYGHPVKI